MTSDGLADATWVAGLLALCGPRLGGALVGSDVCDSFLKAHAAAAGPKGAFRTVSSSLAAEALEGSIDLAATLATGLPVRTAGLLSEGLEALLLARRAEKLDAACASLMARALDSGTLLLVASVDLDDPDTVLAPKLAERLPFLVTDEAEAHWTRDLILQARPRLQADPFSSGMLRELCQTAASVGIGSPRAILQCLSAARGIAALKGLNTVDDACAALAARLVLAHRAQHLPPQPQSDDQPEQAPPPPPPDDQDNAAEQTSRPEDAEVILEAVKAALPAHLLEFGSALGSRSAGRNRNADKSNATGKRGRRTGSRRASSLAGQRLDIIATLRTAAPWQPFRRKFSFADRMIVTRDDFRVARIKQRTEATAIFAVDASGSTAFQRLAEAKGAVESILAECYVRRDKVALVSFRSKTAEVLLPPTRSLERAKRALAGLPGGGGTPLAAGLDEVFILALRVKKSGGSPVIILLTDGRANVTRDGEGNKVKALVETQAAARLFAAEGFDAMVIDVSPNPNASARNLAEQMHARYLPMPRAGAAEIARPVSLALRAASA
jgi:magnesium chelatase subunit D